MARIELRNSTIRIVDGYTNSAEVNKVGVNSGDVTFPIDTLGTSELILEQTRFTVVGSTVTYQVTTDKGSAVYTVDIGAASGGTWAMTFAGQTTGAIAFDADAATVLAALVALSNVTALIDITVTGAGVESSDPWIISIIETSPTHGQIVVVATGDGSNLTASDTLTFTTTHAGAVTHDIIFTPALDSNIADNAVVTFIGRALEVNIGDGNVTWGEKKEYNYDLNKGILDTVRQGNDVPTDLSISAIYDFIKAPSSDLTPTIEEALKQTGRAAAWVSSSSDLCEPYAVDIEIDHVPVCSGVDKETTTIPDFRYESLDHDPREATISATGRANVTQATTTRG